MIYVNVLNLENKLWIMVGTNIYIYMYTCTCLALKFLKFEIFFLHPEYTQGKLFPLNPRRGLHSQATDAFGLNPLEPTGYRLSLVSVSESGSLTVEQF